MGFHTIAGSDAAYGLIAFDAQGKEREEQAGLFSQDLIRRAVDESITDIFFFCHGWKGDLGAAIDQYDNWIGAFMRSGDRAAASQIFPDFRPLLVGLHWPSLPWADEELRGGSFTAVAAPDGVQALLAAYLHRLGDRPEIRRPLQVILNEARTNIVADELAPHVRKAYLDLNDALGLRSDGVEAPPDADREEFDPQDALDAESEDSASFGGDLNLGGLLGPLRQLSYWTMKKRARTIGEGGMSQFLVQLQQATAARNTRIHLMGHSFGTIVISGMIGGPNARGALPRPVDSVVLVQGAVSLWSYAARIPFRNAGAGYFNRILVDNKVRGPLVTTRSRFDDAVGRFYPLASRLRGSANFAGTLPEYGALGAFGIQGLPDDVRSELTMLGVAGAYDFDKGKVYNLDGSQFICKKEGASGAHNDIAGQEVAHVLWAAAFASA
jgi:hypothetical protein